VVKKRKDRGVGRRGPIVVAASVAVTQTLKLADGLNKPTLPQALVLLATALIAGFALWPPRRENDLQAFKKIRTLQL
jgi:hypothetical protein